MSLTQEQIARLTKLSGLSIDNIDTERTSENLNSIIAYVDMLSSVSPETIASLESTTPSAYLRSDEVISSDIPSDTLLRCSPQKVISSQIALQSIMHGES